MRPKFDRHRPLSAQDLNKIHSHSLEVLAHSGMWVECEEARNIYAAHGCSVEGQIVRFPGRLVNQALQSVPSKVTVIAPNSKRKLIIGGKKFAFGPTAGAPFLIDSEGKQRPPSRQELEDLIKLTQSLDVLKFQRGAIAYPRDVPARNLPFYDVLASLLYSDKPIYVHDRHSINMLAIRFGIDTQRMRDAVDQGVAYGGYGNINPQSPLSLSKFATDSLRDLAEFGIPIAIAPAPMAGMTAPCTVPGLLIQQNAEILGTLVLAQIVRPGAPVLYGCIGTVTDMRTGIGAIGAPETRVIEQASAQIARLYNLPSRGDVGLSDSLRVDFQAGAESALNFYSAARSGINLLPGVGAMGSWNHVSFEKMVLDAELAAFVKRMLRPLKFDEENMAVDLIENIGPRGNFIAEYHTVANFRRSIYSPMVFSREAYAEYERRGHRDAFWWAQRRVNTVLSEYTRPDMDPEIERDLREYMRNHMPVPDGPLPGE